MKNYTQKLAIILIPLAIMITISECKKGEDDPFISLRSRKARVAGEWNISKSISTTTSGNPTVICTTSYDGSTEISTCGTSNPSVRAVVNEVTFEKDGTLRWHTETTPAGGTKVTSDYEGIWNFNSGVGELKKKEQISFYFTRITTIDVSGLSRVEMVSSTQNVYDITRLKNKEMVWHAKSVNSLANNGSSNTSSSEETITFTAK